MLTLNRKSDYALISLSHLGRCRGTITSAREIADTYQIPLPLLMNILKQLTREGIIASARGAKGGYRLAVEPADLCGAQFQVQGAQVLVDLVNRVATDIRHGDLGVGENPGQRDLRRCRIQLSGDFVHRGQHRRVSS